MAEIIGIDIGSHSIKIMGLKMTSKGPYLTISGVTKVPRSNPGEDTHALIETLISLVSELSLKTKKVNLAASGKGISLIRLSLPSMPRVEMLEAIRWEIKEQLPFPIERVQIDFHILNEFVEEGVKKLDLMVVACPADLVNRSLSVAEGAGLQASHLDVAPFALWNAFASQHQEGREEKIALVDLGSEKTGIHLFENGKLQFSREVTPAGEDITRAIMEGLGNETDSGLLYEQAEKIKQTVGIRLENDSETPQDEFQDEPPLPRISFWMRPVLERLVSEIGRSFDYYRSQFNVERIDQVFLTGGGANLKNIAPFISNELHLPVECFNPLKKIPFDAKKVDGQLLDQRGTHFAVAFGLALPEAKRIELLPFRKPFWSKVHLRDRGMIPILIPFLTLLGFFGVISKMNGDVVTLRKEYEAKIAQVQNLETLKTKLTLLKENEEKMRQDLSFLLLSSTVSIPCREILREVNQGVPDNMTLTLFEIQPKGKPGKKGAAPPKKPAEESLKDGQKEVHLSGLAFGNDLHCLTALAQVIERLEKSPFFTNAKLISADENRQYNQPGVEFEMVCDIQQNNNPTLMKEKSGKEKQ